MSTTAFLLPLAQRFATPPGHGLADDPMLFVAGMGLLLLVLLVYLLRRRNRADRTPDAQAILIDGSNVMHWQDNTPRLEPLLQVVQELSALGLKPGVVFDANAGYHLAGRYLGERELGRMLALPQQQILVVPKGTQADAYLLETARDLKAKIVTNDRYRDWVEGYPEVAGAGMLITGGVQGGRVWLEGLEAETLRA
jgi:hypothetical protein